jgi:hypothetical protein
MRLTSLWLILLTGGLAVLAMAGTVWFWRIARGRTAVRITGLILIEALVVLCAGLVANRADSFFPTWQALTGDSDGDPAPQAVRQAPGKLDSKLAAASGAGLAWTPAGYTTWHLAAPPVLIAPAGYRKRTDHTFPVIVVIAAEGQKSSIRAAAASVPDVLTLVVTPGPATTVADLAALPGRLAHDARAMSDGWAVVTDQQYGALARGWQKSAPARIRTVADFDVRHPAAAFGAAARSLPEALAAPVRLPS